MPVSTRRTKRGDSHSILTIKNKSSSNSNLKSSSVRSTIKASKPKSVRSTINASKPKSVRSTINASKSNSVRSTINAPNTQSFRKTNNASAMKKSTITLKPKVENVESDYEKTSRFLIQNRADLLYDALKGKNVGLMNGCFCPPHVGHYNSFKKAIETLKLNLLFLQTINNSTARLGRHGTAGSHTYKVLIMFAKKLKEETGCDVLIENCPGCPPIIKDKKDKEYKFDNRVAFFNWIPVDVENVFKIEYVENDKQRSKTIILDDKNFSANYFKELRLKAPDKFKHIKLERPDDGLSATKFSKCLSEIKSGKSDRNSCDKYISHLTETEKKEYLKEVLRYDTNKY